MKPGLNILLSSLLVLLLLSSVEEFMLVGGANNIRPPEHTCKQEIRNGIGCKPLECDQGCFEELHGTGVCRDGACLCSYQCLQPPQ